MNRLIPRDTHYNEPIFNSKKQITFIKIKNKSKQHIYNYLYEQTKNIFISTGNLIVLNDLTFNTKKEMYDNLEKIKSDNFIILDITDLVTENKYINPYKIKYTGKKSRINEETVNNIHNTHAKTTTQTQFKAKMSIYNKKNMQVKSAKHDDVYRTIKELYLETNYIYSDDNINGDDFNNRHTMSDAHYHNIKNLGIKISRKEINYFSSIDAALKNDIGNIKNIFSITANVISLDNNMALIDIGSIDGVHSGDKYTIYRLNFKTNGISGKKEVNRIIIGDAYVSDIIGDTTSYVIQPKDVVIKSGDILKRNFINL